MKVEAAVGTIFFVAAMILSLLKYPDYVTKENQSDIKISKYAKALYYMYGYLTIVLKAIVVLVFIFVFIMVFNVITLGVFKPLMSEDVGSNASVYGNTGYGDIIAKAKNGYFAVLGAIAERVFKTTFHVIHFENVLIAFLVFAPVFILCVCFLFHLLWSPKDKTKDKDKDEDIDININADIDSDINPDSTDTGAYMTTNYHLLSTFFYTLFVVLLLYTTISCLFG